MTKSLKFYKFKFKGWCYEISMIFNALFVKFNKKLWNSAEILGILNKIYL